MMTHAARDTSFLPGSAAFAAQSTEPPANAVTSDRQDIPNARDDANLAQLLKDNSINWRRFDEQDQDVKRFTLKCISAENFDRIPEWTTLPESEILPMVMMLLVSGTPFNDERACRNLQRLLNRPESVVDRKGNTMWERVFLDFQLDFPHVYRLTTWQLRILYCFLDLEIGKMKPRLRYWHNGLDFPWDGRNCRVGSGLESTLR